MEEMEHNMDGREVCKINTKSPDTTAALIQIQVIIVVAIIGSLAAWAGMGLSKGPTQSQERRVVGAEPINVARAMAAGWTLWRLPHGAPVRSESARQRVVAAASNV